MLQAIDTAVSVALNAVVGGHAGFDSLLVQLSSNHLLKSVPPVTAIWFLWWSDTNNVQHRRASLLMLLAACFAAMATVRVLSQVLPFRVRPLHQADLELRLAHDLGAGTLEAASSLPSDHAGLFFALATGLWIIARQVGVLALLHATLLVALPRIVLGLHFLSDIVVGAAIGAVTAWAFTRPRWIDGPGRRAADAVERRAALAYSALFVVTSQMASMFEPLRRLGRWLHDLLLR